jgi:hypothetical protein
VIGSDSFDGMSSKEKQQGLIDEFISRVYQLTSRKDNKPVPLCTLVLIFECMGMKRAHVTKPKFGKVGKTIYNVPES